MPKKKDLTGQRFGRLVVLSENGRNNNGNVCWKCQCDCGKKCIISSNRLVKGDTKSCGCIKKENAKKAAVKHNQSSKVNYTPVYKTWQAMIQRCYNPNSPNYLYYGSRGIKVCERWWSFENFYVDVGDRPKGKTLDRKNPDDDYNPINWRWATPQEQAQTKKIKKGKGYFWNKQKQKWQAYILVRYKGVHLGFFDTENEARKAYIEAKKKYHNVYLDE